MTMNPTDPQSMFQQASPDDQHASVISTLQSMTPEQRGELAQLLNLHPATEVQADDHASLAAALVQHAQAEQQVTAHQPSESPLQSVFGSGGLLGSPLAKMALVAAAGIIGSRLLNHD